MASRILLLLLLVFSATVSTMDIHVPSTDFAQLSPSEKKAHAIAYLSLLRLQNPPEPPKSAPKFQLKQNKDGSIWRPVVLMHGIRGDNTSMIDVEQWVQDAFPGIYTTRIQVGNGYWDSILMQMPDQVADFCQQVNADPNLSKGFNLIGFSQGTLVTRGFIQKCNSPPVYNYISWAGPQGGIFGTPYVDNSWLDWYLGEFPYWSWVQETIAPAEYWKDPYDLEDYLSSSIYLADINNEREEKNPQYKEKITALNNMALIYSTNDEIITPKESGWFWFYAPNSMDLVPLQQSALYTEDWIGLRTLDEQGKLYFGQTNCSHSEHKHDGCKYYFELHTLQFLNNTL